MIKNLLQEGFALKNNGHYKHAIEVFYKALEEDNCSTELMLEIANLYYLIHNEEKALSYIEQILEKDAKHIEALKLLKQIFLDKCAFLEAEQTAKNIYCISREEDDLAEIFRLLNIQGKYNEIFEYNIEHNNVKIYTEIAKALFLKNDFDKSREVTEKALTIEPENPRLLLMLGYVYYAQDNKEKCVELLAKIPENTDSAELQNFCGLMADYLGDYQKAYKYILKAIKLNPKYDKYYYNLANIYFKQGDLSYAKNYYNRAIALNPQNQTYHFALANLFYSEKRYKRALEELQGDFFESNLLKAIILYDTGYIALAKIELKKLAEDHPENQILQEYQRKIEEELRLN